MEEAKIRVREQEYPIDFWEDALDEKGNKIYASQELEKKFERTGWTKRDARFEGVRLVKCTQDLSQYATPNRQTVWLAKNENNGTSFVGFIDDPSLSKIKPIETYYKGYRFRSRLEARWAVFFDACGVEWEYEPEGFDLGDGIWYLPDFLLHGVSCRAEEDLWVEVKGVMTPEDEEKIIRFSGYRHQDPHSYGPLENPIYVVGNIPEGETFNDFINNLDMYHKGAKVPFFNFQFIDGDYYGAIPCMTKNGFEICGDDNNYLWDVDERKTMEALRAARQARFEFGESGYKNNF